MSNNLARMPTRRLAAFGQTGLALACACLAAVGTSRAQSSGSTVAGQTASRLLSPKEGRAIVNVAWQQELPAQGVQDCSHLVHEIYENAGFAYPYASSFEIYAGNENFVRVKYPRPGDLIAWPGHVGIIVDPAEHTFYSLVRTGLQEQDYQSAYWRSRGRPRFFRLRLENGTVLTASGTTSDRPPGAAPPSSIEKSSARAKVSPSPKQSIDVVPDDERAALANRSADRPPTAASDKKWTVYGPPAPPTPTDDGDSPDADTRGKNGVYKDRVYEVADAAPFEPPKSIVVATGSKVPSREELAEGISELSDGFGGLLQRDDAFTTSQPVVIIDQLTIEKVEIKRDHGWAHVAIDWKVSISGGVVQAKRRHERVRWELRRTETGWQAIAPADRTYVPHDVAVKSLAAQLARIAASDGAAQHDETVLRREAQIVGALGALLERK